MPNDADVSGAARVLEGTLAHAHRGQAAAVPQCSRRGWDGDHGGSPNLPVRPLHRDGGHGIVQTAVHDKERR